MPVTKSLAPSFPHGAQKPTFTILRMRNDLRSAIVGSCDKVGGRSGRLKIMYRSHCQSIGSPLSCPGRRSSSQCPCPQTNWHAYLAGVADCGRNGTVFSYMGLIGFVRIGIWVYSPNESMIYHNFPDVKLAILQGICIEGERVI